MRNILLTILFFKISIGISQSYFFGDFQQRYSIEKKLYLDDRYHSISKPVLLDSALKQEMQMGVWLYGNPSDTAKFLVLPFVDAGLKYNYTDQDLANALSMGAQFNYSNKKWKTQLRRGYSLGMLSNYESSNLTKRPYAPGIGYLSNDTSHTYSQPLVEGYISYQPHRFFNLSGGVGKNIIGDGYRSIYLSDYAPAYPFLKMESTFWKVKYINLWSLHHDQNTASFNNQKWSSLHALSFNVTKWLNLSLFESVIWQGKDTLNNRGFDYNYLNPFIFFRPVEYGIGSSDNSFFGGGLKIRFPKKIILYQHLILDEFLLSAFQDRSGWWGNKYGIQVGMRFFDLMAIEGLYSLVEWNAVRPFTYSHMNSMQNYGHRNQSLAHPLESNFHEVLFLLGYQKNTLDFWVKYAYQYFGRDFQHYNFGGDMFQPYTSRAGGDYGHEIGQGNTINQHQFEIRTSLLLVALSNTKLFTQFNYRYNTSINNTIAESSLFSIGITSNLWQSYLDY